MSHFLQKRLASKQQQQQQQLPLPDCSSSLASNVPSERRTKRRKDDAVHWFLRSDALWTRFLSQGVGFVAPSPPSDTKKRRRLPDWMMAKKMDHKMRRTHKTELQLPSVASADGNNRTPEDNTNNTSGGVGRSRRVFSNLIGGSGGAQQEGASVDERTNNGSGAEKRRGRPRGGTNGNNEQQTIEYNRFMYSAPEKQKLMLVDYDRYVQQRRTDLELVRDQIVFDASALKCTLHEHQQRAFEWMCGQEMLSMLDGEAYNGSGVLADDMGLGKTLSTLTLIAAHRPTSLLTERRACDTLTTLVICPTSLIDEWQREIGEHFHEAAAPSIYVMHGTNVSQSLRSMQTERFVEQMQRTDILISNYETAQSHIALLRQVRFLRIVLDESHRIKNQKSACFRHLSNLQSCFRWCLTGSPINNSIADLQSLVLWLRYKPYNMRSLWNATIDVNLKVYYQQQQQQQEEEDEDDTEPDEYELNRRNMCEQLILRRTKDILVLPERTVHYVRVAFNDEERRLYDHFWSSAKQMVSERELTILLGDTTAPLITPSSQRPAPPTGRFLHYEILQKLLRVRQTCDHPSLLDSNFCSMPVDRAFADELVDTLRERKKQKECSEQQQSEVTTSDSTRPTPVVYSSMLDDFMNGADFDQQQAEEQKREQEAADEARRTVSANETVYPSAKLRMLLPLLRSELLQTQQQQQQQQQQRPVKCVIFSQWTSMLDVVQASIEQMCKEKCISDFNVLRIDGSQDRKERSRVQQLFNSDPTARVLCASTTACSLGLNLQVANIAYIMEPWWNPQVERQAIDRLHRLGQTREVTIYRFVVKDTIEERVMEVQKQKEQLADSMLDNKNVH